MGAEVRHLDSSSQSRSNGGAKAGAAVWGNLLVVTALLALVAAAMLHPLAAPALSIVLVAVGFIWAGVIMIQDGFSVDAPSDRMTSPAVILFLGFAAGMLSDPDHLVTHWFTR